MASEFKAAYGTTQTINVTGLSTLANGSSATSDAIDNTGNLFLDALVELVVDTATGASATGYIEIYIKGSIDGTDYDDDNNDKWAGTLNLVTGGALTRKRIVSVASAFGGAMPAFWQVRIKNTSGAVFSSGVLQIRGVKAQAV
jgi:hypothetical protein